MKAAFSLIGLLIILGSFKSFRRDKPSVKELRTELIGTWEFVELRDKNDNKIDTLWDNRIGAYEIPRGPIITYSSDGSYLQKFTPKNIYKGRWTFDNNNNAIIHRLYYEKPYDLVSRHLISIGHAKKDDYGNYYEIITDTVLELSFTRLVILEREDRKRIFKKVGQ